MSEPLPDADLGASWVFKADAVKDNREAYYALYGAYKALYPASRPFARALAGIQTGADST